MRESCLRWVGHVQRRAVNTQVRNNFDWSWGHQKKVERKNKMSFK